MDSQLLRNTTTDSEGEYAFNIAPNTCYRVRVPLDQPSLHDWKPTAAFVGHDPRIDSNGVEQGGYSVADVSPEAPGHNNFTYDFGFIKGTPPEEEKPDEPPPESGGLVVEKHVLRHTQTTVEYVIGVQNSGPNLIVDVRVCDTLPAELELVSVNAPGHTSTGQEVCWHIASLPAGGQQTFELTARVRAGTLTGTVVNGVEVRGTEEPAGPDLPGRPVGPVRDTATVRGRPRPPPAVTG